MRVRDALLAAALALAPLEAVRDRRRAHIGAMQPVREKPYPSDVSDEEWALVAPYVALLPEDAPQRDHDLREVFNARKWLARAGAPWRLLPHDFPPWWIVYQQSRRWLVAGVFEAMVHDLRLLLRDCAGRRRRPTAAIMDSRTLQSTPESGGRAGWDGAKRRKGSKLHLAVDTLGHLLAAQQAEADAAAHGIRLEVVKHTEAKRGFILLPRRWVAERSFAWATRFRRLAKDYERLPSTLAGLHFFAFVCLMVQKAAPLLASGP